MNEGPGREVLLIDDDEVSRELLMMFIAETGCQGVSAESGDEALAKVQAMNPRPHAVFADMQMTGTTGNALARELRRVCGSSTRLIAMSGSGVEPEETADFDGFLLKPFTVDQLWLALEERAGTDGPACVQEPAGHVLNEAVYSSLSQSMPQAQLMKLYVMCMDDAERRIGLMRQASTAGDVEGYRGAAHAIKGGCGMVGAAELAALADAMEQNGPASGGEMKPLEEFLLASARLRRILEARVV